MRVTRQLVLEIDRSEVPVGEPITVRVRDTSNRPVEGAVVGTERKRKRTDENGTCQFTFRAPGFWKLSAVKSAGDRVRYEPTARLVRAVPAAASSRRARRLDAPRW